MGRIKNAITKLKNNYIRRRRRSKLKYKDFTIISNNCWAGTAVYQPFGLKYNTPTVGLFIMDEDYIRFLERLEWYLKQPLSFISPQDSRYYDKISAHGTKDVKYPIAALGKDVELHFLHYKSPEEAFHKWERRKNRINFNRLIVKMSLRDNAYDIQQMHSRFKRLSYNNKFCFSPEPDADGSNEIITVPELRQLNLVGGDETEYTLQRIDVYALLNSID